MVILRRPQSTLQKKPYFASFLAYSASALPKMSWERRPASDGRGPGLVRQQAQKARKGRTWRKHGAQPAAGCGRAVYKRVLFRATRKRFKSRHRPSPAVSSVSPRRVSICARTHSSFA
eukprot:4723134-Pleurochrysis_carterae.AAC.2